MARIGIYAGTFNPVHVGHVTLALQSIEQADLDTVYFLPERQSRYKKGVEHYSHRVGMLERALQPHPFLQVLDLPDPNLNVGRTLTRLQKLHPDDELVFIFGSDAALDLPNWPLSDRLLLHTELLIGIRDTANREAVEQNVASWAVQPRKLHIVNSYAPDVSSTLIREALSKRTTARGLLTSVARYSNRNWLYISLSKLS